MKKIIAIISFTFIVNFASAQVFEEPPSVPIVMIGVADFKTFDDAKSGGVGNNFRTIPEFLLTPNSITTPENDSPATCIVNDEGKATIRKNNKVRIFCEKTEAVILRIGIHVTKGSN